MQELPGEKVVGARRVTIEKAIESLPDVENPDDVTDIWYNVGLNDSRSGFSPERVSEDTLQMLKIYHKKFKNARHHVTGLLPLDDRQIETNRLLKKLTDNTGSMYVSTKAFRDKNTGNLRSNLIKDGFHLMPIGIGTLAKAVKKSLFSPNKTDDDSLAHIVKICDMVEQRKISA